jgi:membrane-associated phospholipid phosphatase
MRLLNTFDKRATAAIRDLPEPYKPLMTGVTFLGEPLVVLSVGFIGFIVAILQTRPAIEHVFAYAAIAFGLNILLKMSLHRRRPYGLIIETLGVRSYSFPSGHAFGTVIFYGLLAYLDIKYWARPGDIAIAAALTVLIVLIGISRVYLSAHYPSDVIAGWLLGSLSLLIVVSLAF